jgi:hypothetical protein
MNLTRFKFFKNTPLNDFENTIHFTDNQARDDFFDSGVYISLSVITTPAFNFVKDRQTIQINYPYLSMTDVNYCYWETDADSVKRYYAKVVEFEYINDECTRVHFVIDGIMTFLQGDFTSNLVNFFVERQHYSKINYNNNIERIRKNNDILQTYTLNSTNVAFMPFGDLQVVFESSADLSKPLGTTQDPKMSTSKGQIYDGVIGATSLYTCAYTDFQALMDAISNFPWISQNFSNIKAVPKAFLNLTNLTPVVASAPNDWGGVLFQFPNNAMSTTGNVNTSISNTLTMSTENIYKTFGLSDTKPHLLRSPYETIEMMSYNGQSVPVDIAKLPNANNNKEGADGLMLTCMLITGYDTKCYVFPMYYNQFYEEPNTSDTLLKSRVTGNGLNNALIFQTFDNVPILIDNYKLQLAKTQHSRTLDMNRQAGGRVSNALTGSANTGAYGRIMDAVSVGSDMTNIKSAISANTSQYEWFRSQKAQIADMALTSPTITQQTDDNFFQIANGIFGVFIKYSRINDSELSKADRYYSLFGFDCSDSEFVDSIESMSIVNFLKGNGNITIQNCENSILQVIKTQIQEGVKFWHSDGKTANPFEQDVTKNEIIK